MRAFLTLVSLPFLVLFYLFFWCQYWNTIFTSELKLRKGRVSLIHNISYAFAIALFAFSRCHMTEICKNISSSYLWLAIFVIYIVDTLGTFFLHGQGNDIFKFEEMDPRLLDLDAELEVMCQTEKEDEKPEVVDETQQETT